MCLPDVAPRRNRHHAACPQARLLGRRGATLHALAGHSSLREFQSCIVASSQSPAPAFYNVYAYCRWADDLGDEIPDPDRPLELLHWWEHGLNACYEGKPSHPVFVPLRETIIS